MDLNMDSDKDRGMHRNRPRDRHRISELSSVHKPASSCSMFALEIFSW